MRFNLEDTIVAIASPPGGAVRGIVRVSGPAALECAGRLFDSSEPAFVGRSRVPYFRKGLFRLDPPLTTVPASAYVWPTIRSYSGQPTVEIHTVGSPPLLEAMVRAFCQKGARLADPGEFTLRAFLAGRIDLTQAEAVLGVIDARNGQQLRTALQQLAGGLSAALNGVRNQLLNLLAEVEAGLDFVDEQIEFISADSLTHQLSDAADRLQQLLDRLGARGDVSHKPRIVVRGRPNAGKSTLWNSLVSRDQAIVSDVPGTTRDYLSAEVCFGGIEAQLIDTAGVSRELNQHPIDVLAQQMARAVSETADIELFCIDATCELYSWELQELQAAKPMMGRIVVLTKLDANPNPQTIHRATAAQAIPSSSRTGLGLDLLRAELASVLSSNACAESGAVAATASRCRQSITRALDSIRRSLQLATDGEGEELIAAEIRCALDELGLVVGAVYTDDILDRIFSRFCIGK
jgi:tRNA modification GTPase